MVTYIHNITLLITLTVLYTMVLQRVNKEELNGQIYSGILFGIFAILCMTTPFQIREGVIFDARSVILSIAGLFGGPITAALSITIASIYRFIIGGAGVVVGIFTIVQSGIIGVVFFHMFKKRVNRSLRNIFIMSVIIHIIMLISFLYIPNISFNIVINLLAVPTMIIYPLATVIISFIILEDNRKDKITEQIKISQKRLENIIEAAEVGTWEWNLKEDTKEYNNRWAEIIG